MGLRGAALSAGRLGRHVLLPLKGTVLLLRIDCLWNFILFFCVLDAH